MKRKVVRLSESDLHSIIEESVKRIISESTFDTPYGKVSNEPLKPTFDDAETQGRLKNDVVEMLPKLSDERFMKYWEKRLSFTDPDVVDAIYQEYYRRHQGGKM